MNCTQCGNDTHGPEPVCEPCEVAAAAAEPVCTGCGEPLDYCECSFDALDNALFGGEL